MPVEFIHKSIFAHIPTINPNNVSHNKYAKSITDDQQAVIVFNIFYQGANAVSPEYTAPLLAIDPVVTVANVTD